MHDHETLLLCGSYKIMQDLLCSFQEISCISMHDHETLLLCGSYKIMQDLLCSFQENSWIFNHDLETLLLVEKSSTHDLETF